MWGGGGGGGMWGGGGGGGQQGGQHWSGTGGGAKFMGIPPEIEDKVKFLVDKEPDFELQAVPFTQVYDDNQKPFTLRRFLAPKKWPIFGVLVLIAMEVFCQQYGPRLVANAVNEGIAPVINGGTGDFSIVLRDSLLYFGLLIGAIVIGALRTAWSGRVGEDLLYGLRVRVFSQIQRLSMDYFSGEKAGRIMTRVTSDVEAIQVLFQQGLVNMVLQVFTVIFVVWQLFSMNVTLALWVTLGVVPVLTILTWWFRSASDHGYLAVRDWIAAVIGDLAENLSGTRVVAAHNRQRYNVVKHDNIVGSYRAANMYTGNVAGIYGPGAQFVGVLGQALVLFIGGRMVIDGKLSLGDFTAFNLYLNRFFQPIQQLAQLYNTYQQGNAGVVKLRELFDTKPAVRERPGARRPSGDRG